MFKYFSGLRQDDETGEILDTDLLQQPVGLAQESAGIFLIFVLFYKSLFLLSLRTNYF